MLGVTVAVLLLVFAAGAARARAEPAEAGPVVVFEVEGTISEGLPNAAERAVERAESADAAALIVHLRTFGGLVTAATAIKDELLASRVPTIAYVDRRAISAGALIALSTDRIVMAPGGSIGAATPYRQESGGSAEVSEKMTSALRSVFRATAEAKGHSPDLAGAMVDADVAVDGVIEAGKLLTLTSAEAVDLGLASGTAGDLDALLADEGLAGSERITITRSPAEKLADVLTSPAIAGLLLSIALWAMFAAFKMPGTGIPEIIAVLAIAAFLFGKQVAGLAGWEDVALIGVGAALLALEIFVIPGLGVAAVLGILALAAGLVLAAVGDGPSSPFFWDSLERGLETLGIAVVLALVWSTIAFLALRKTRLWKRLTLAEHQTAPDVAMSAFEGPATGSPARTGTALRPEGEIEVDGRRYPARASRGYLGPGVDVVVEAREGARVVVREAEASDATSAADGEGRSGG